MTLQTDAPLERLSLHAGNRRAVEIARTWVGENWLLIDPPYQRESVWTQQQRVALVRSWVSGIPVPAILVNDRRASGLVASDDADSPTFALVDGRQRVETAVAWFGGALAVPASWFPAQDLEQVESTADGPYVRYSGLSRSAQLGMNSDAMLPVIEANLPTVAAEADLFLTVNAAGTAQTDADLARARAVAAA